MCSPGTSAAACRSARRVSLRLARPDRAARYGLADWQVCPALPIGRPRLASLAGRLVVRTVSRSSAGVLHARPAARPLARPPAESAALRLGPLGLPIGRPSRPPAAGRSAQTRLVVRPVSRSVGRSAGSLARQPGCSATRPADRLVGRLARPADRPVRPCRSRRFDW